jgi:hypothetical protein
LRFPHLAHRPAAVHKLHSATAARIDLDSGKGETFSRLRALAYPPGTCPDDQDHRHFPTFGLQLRNPILIPEA